MNTRAINIILPIIAVLIYVCIEFLYIFLARSRYEPIIENIQKGERMQFDMEAGIICYAGR